MEGYSTINKVQYEYGSNGVDTEQLTEQTLGTRSRRSSSVTNQNSIPSLDVMSHILPPIETRLRSSTNPLLGPEPDEETDLSLGLGMSGSPVLDYHHSHVPPPVAHQGQIGLPSIMEQQHAQEIDIEIGFPPPMSTLEMEQSVSTSTAHVSALEIGPESIESDTKVNSNTTTLQRVTKYVRYFFSSALSLIYLGYIFWGILTGQAVLPGPPVAHLCVFLSCLLLIGYLEGLKIAILAVERQSPESRRISHPRAFQLMTTARHENTIERFLVGRQFVTIFIMTLMAQVTSFPDISHLGISPVVWFIMIQTGLPGAMIVTTMGSLQPQLLAAKDPWLFLDMYGCNTVLNVCCAAEATGVCTHFAWMLIAFLKRTVFVSEPHHHLLQTSININMTAVRNNDDDHIDGENAKSASASASTSASASVSPSPQQPIATLACEGLKYLVSTVIVLLSLAFLMFGIWTGEAILPLPPVGVFFTLAFCFVSLFFLEGLQVAVLVAEGRANFESLRHSYPNAYSLMQKVTFGKNVRRFLVGRQFFVVFIVFLVNQCTIFPSISHLGVNDVIWLIIVQLGLPTALCVLCFAQLPAQLLASHDPTLFMNRPGPMITLQLCLLMETTGLVHFAWVLAAFSRASWFKARGNDQSTTTTTGMKKQNSYSDIRSTEGLERGGGDGDDLSASSVAMGEMNGHTAASGLNSMYHTTNSSTALNKMGDSSSSSSCSSCSNDIVVDHLAAIHTGAELSHVSGVSTDLTPTSNEIGLSMGMGTGIGIGIGVGMELDIDSV